MAKPRDLQMSMAIASPHPRPSPLPTRGHRLSPPAAITSTGPLAPTEPSQASPTIEGWRGRERFPHLLPHLAHLPAVPPPPSSSPTSQQFPHLPSHLRPPLRRSECASIWLRTRWTSTTRKAARRHRA